MPILQSCPSSEPNSVLAASSLGPDNGDCRASREEAGQGSHWPVSPLTCKAKTYTGIRYVPNPA